MRTSTTDQKRHPRDLRAANRQDSIDAATWGQGGTVNIATKFFSPPSKCPIDLFGPVANRRIPKRLASALRFLLVSLHALAWCLREDCNSTPSQPCCSRPSAEVPFKVGTTRRASLVGSRGDGAHKSASCYTTEMKGLVAGYASSGDEASSSDDEPAKPPRAAVREGPRAGRRESRWAIQARAILPPEIRAAQTAGRPTPRHVSGESGEG